MSKAIVTYFSITGVTAGAAELLAKAIGADIYEIKPDSPYTDSDLSWQNSDSNQETESAPVITFEHQCLKDYDTIFLGLPIWWYAAPTIINTFLEGYDLAGKTIVPFATSGGGGIDKVRPRLLESCAGADLKEATLLCGDLKEEELRKWAASMTQK